MRKSLILGIAALVSLGAGSAMAEVSVYATIDKTKDVTVLETINITKIVDIYAFVILTADKAAESEALINQENYRNKGCENCAEKRDIIRDSANNNSGVLSINQATGNMNNQGNAVAAAVDFVIIDGDTPVDGDGVGFAESQAAVEQANGIWSKGGDESSEFGDGWPGNTINSWNLLFREALIAGSFNNNSGIVHFNQAAGNMANQANALSLAVSFADGGVALSEADLGQYNIHNIVQESDTGPEAVIGIHKLASLTGSLNGNSGIVGGNQSAGHMANQANVVSFSAAQLSE